jgi:hypothetical protein
VSNKNLPPNCSIDKGKYVIWKKQIKGKKHSMSLGKIDDGLKKIWAAYQKHVVQGKPIKRKCHSKHPLYKTWKGIIQRCTNPDSQGYKHYGGRGISICSRWANNFELFAKDMGKKPSPKHSIDRINNDGNYEPSNCRWADPVTQANNTRVQKRQRVVLKMLRNGEPIDRIVEEMNKVLPIKRRW